MLTVQKAGIDTIGIAYATEKDIEELKHNYATVEKHSKIIGNNRALLVVKPSKVVNGGVEVTGAGESLEVIGIMEVELNLGSGEFKRVDITADTDEGVKSNRQLFRLFLECLNLRRRGEEEYNPDLFQTKKGLKVGNMKIATKRTQTTIYDCTDKARKGKARIENRILDIRTKAEYSDIVTAEIKKYLKELELLEELTPLVEERYIDLLHQEYKETLGINFITFSEFVAWADIEGLILTEGILKGLLKKCGIKTNFKEFTRTFRKNRSGSLKFSSKTELKKLVQDLKKELKKALKN